MDKKAALIVRVLPIHLCRNHIVRNRIQRRCQRNGAQSRRSSQRDGRSYSILEGTSTCNLRKAYSHHCRTTCWFKGTGLFYPANTTVGSRVQLANS
ncbi:hypothetical protein BC938DRAFT_483524 [Jimgerdemannia flammicorona]|uniref:Uncharacterized protein n=1 Tax=Jimgerdemannia flammicorona TaxID=994334 RepID=A0A433QVK5_9FUNG|nr:hypothetical protein BC938DRAFT_483524 [Jimgerdemannia flammicorona]